MKRGITGIILAALLSATPGEGRLLQNRGANAVNLTGQIIVPVSDFQEMFEVLLLRNAEELVQATVADSQGRYRFLGVPRGTYFVNVKIEGFEEVRQRVDLASNSIVNIILDFKEERVTRPPTDFSGEDSEVVDTADLSQKYPASVIEKTKAAGKDLQSGNFAKAILPLEEVVQEAPDLYQAHIMLGTAYQKSDRFRDAESEFRTAADLRQTSAAPLINLASLYVEEAEISAGQGTSVVRGILNEALGSLNAAIKLNPDAPFAYYLLGVTYYKSAFYEDAEEHLKHSLELAPDLIDAHLALANVYVKMQEWSNAIAQLDAYLEASPKTPTRDQVQQMRSRVVSRSQARIR